MDDSIGLVMMQADGIHVVTNGQGDPSNVLNVIASSDTVHLSTKTHILASA